MNSEFGKADILEIIFRHKLKIILVPVVVLVLTVAALLLLPRKYRSEAKLYLQVGRESLGMDATATIGPSSGLIQSNRDEEVKSALQIIESRGVIAQVVDKLGPSYVLNGGEGEGEAPNPLVATIKNGIGRVISVLKNIDPITEREEAIIEIEKNLDVQAERASMVLAAKFDSKSPAAAQKVLETIVDIYRTEHLRIHRNRQSGEFLSDQRDILLKQYMKAQECVKNAKNRYSISSIDGRRTSLETRLQSIELDKVQNLQNLTSSRAKASEIQARLDSVPERETSSQKSIPNEGADLLQKELYTNQIRHMDQKSRLAPDHPLLVASAKQIEEAKRMIENQENQRHETVDDINPIYRALSLELLQQESVIAGFAARQRELMEQHEEITSTIEEFNSNAVHLTQLEHDESIARDKYLQYTNNLEQSRIDRELEEGKISSVSIAQDATLAEKPVSPSKLLVMLGGVFLAMGTIVATVFASEKLNDRIRNEGDMSKYLGLPVLGTIEENQFNKKILGR